MAVAMALNAHKDSSPMAFRGLSASGSSGFSEVLHPALDSPWRLPWHLPDEHRHSRRRSLRQAKDQVEAVRQEANQCGYDGGGLVHALMPVIWSLRLFLMLPVSISAVGPKQRVFRFRWWSWIMAVTFAAWSLLVVVAYYVVRIRVDAVTGGDTNKHYHLYDTVPRLASAFSLSYIFFVPFTCWTTANRHVAFIQHWASFEAEMRSLLEADLSLSWLRRLAWLYAAAGVGMPVIMQCMALTTLPDENAWMVPVMLHSFIFMTLGIIFWMLCCTTFSRVALYQANRLPADVRRLGLRGLRAHRRIWLGMAHSLELMAASWGRMQLLLLAITFVSLTTISFLYAHFFRSGQWDGRAVWLGTAWIFCFIAICTICNSAYVATSGLRDPFIKKLLWISRLVKDEKTCAEISQFLADIKAESPVVSLGGLTVLNRSSILSVFALAITYLIVLSQFTISSESAVVNFSEVPASFDAMYDPDS